MIRSPICYVNAFFQDNAQECLRLAQKDLNVDGIITSSRIVDLVDAYFAAIVQYFGHNPAAYSATTSFEKLPPSDYRFHVNIGTQTLTVCRLGSSTIEFTCKISTSRFGIGYVEGSFCTPIGTAALSPIQNLHQ
jgi:hypothetical protein